MAVNRLNVSGVINSSSIETESTRPSATEEVTEFSSAEADATPQGGDQDEYSSRDARTRLRQRQSQNRAPLVSLMAEQSPCVVVWTDGFLDQFVNVINVHVVKGMAMCIAIASVFFMWWGYIQWMVFRTFPQVYTMNTNQGVWPWYSVLGTWYMTWAYAIEFAWACLVIERIYSICAMLECAVLNFQQRHLAAKYFTDKFPHSLISSEKWKCYRSMCFELSSLRWHVLEPMVVTATGIVG